MLSSFVSYICLQPFRLVVTSLSHSSSHFFFIIFFIFCQSNHRSTHHSPSIRASYVCSRFVQNHQITVINFYENRGIVRRLPELKYFRMETDLHICINMCVCRLVSFASFLFTFRRILFVSIHLQLN